MAALETVGQIDIEPPLREEERETFALLTHPHVDGLPGRSTTGCCWVVCRDGCCLRLEDADGVEDAVQWLRYAVDVLAERGEHTLVGLVAASREDDGQIFTVRVTPQRRVHGKVLRDSRVHRPDIAGVIDLARVREARR